MPRSGKKPNWANGIAGELVFSSFAIAMGSMAITLNPKYAEWIFMACVLFYTLHSLMRWMERKNWIWYRRVRAAGE